MRSHFVPAAVALISFIVPRSLALAGEHGSCNQLGNGSKYGSYQLSCETHLGREDAAAVKDIGAWRPAADFVNCVNLCDDFPNCHAAIFDQTASKTRSCFLSDEALDENVRDSSKTYDIAVRPDLESRQADFNCPASPGNNSEVSGFNVYCQRAYGLTLPVSTSFETRGITFNDCLDICGNNGTCAWISYNVLRLSCRQWPNPFQTAVVEKSTVAVATKTAVPTTTTESCACYTTSVVFV